MKLENQVCSIEFAKKLKELGVKQDGYCQYKRFSNRPDGSEHWVLDDGCRMGKIDGDCISAFTVAELGEMLPSDFISSKVCGPALYRDKDKNWCCDFYNVKTPFMKTEADARAKMLAYLLENKFI